MLLITFLQLKVSSFMNCGSENFNLIHYREKWDAIVPIFNFLKLHLSISGLQSYCSLLLKQFPEKNWRRMHFDERRYEEMECEEL